VKRARSIQEFLPCLLHVTCEKLNFLPRKEHLRAPPLTQPLHTNHEAVRCCSEGESHVRNIIEWDFGNKQSEELLSQLLEDVIGSGRNKEDPGSPPPPPFCIPSTGRACHWAPAARNL
jgi:hypothetical protein